MSGQLLAPEQQKALSEMRHVVATTALAFLLAVAAGAVATRRGTRSGAIFYSATAAGAGLWYARFAQGPGTFLAGTGVSAGVLVGLDWLVGLLEQRVRASGVVTIPYRGSAQLFPNPHDLAARAVAACSAAAAPAACDVLVP